MARIGATTESEFGGGLASVMLCLCCRPLIEKDLAKEAARGLARPFFYLLAYLIQGMDVLFLESFSASTRPLRGLI